MTILIDPLLQPLSQPWYNVAPAEIYEQMTPWSPAQAEYTCQPYVFECTILYFSRVFCLLQ